MYCAEGASIINLKIQSIKIYRTLLLLTSLMYWWARRQISKPKAPLWEVLQSSARGSRREGGRPGRCGLGLGPACALARVSPAQAGPVYSDYLTLLLLLGTGQATGRDHTPTSLPDPHASSSVLPRKTLKRCVLLRFEILSVCGSSNGP